VAASREELVRAFVELHRLNKGDRADRLASDAHFWAWERVSEITAAGGDEAVEVIDDLLHAGGVDDDYIAMVGAGPIQDLLYSDGIAVAALVAERCRLDAAWRSALITVLGYELPPEVQRMLQPYMPHAG